jgi:hypothetical protein
MRWEEKGRRPEYLIGFPCLHSKEIVYDAYREGFINWNTLNKVLQKINTNMNGGWMFEQKQEGVWVGNPVAIGGG